MTVSEPQWIFRGKLTQLSNEMACYSLDILSRDVKFAGDLLCLGQHARILVFDHLNLVNGPHDE